MKIVTKKLKIVLLIINLLMACSPTVVGAHGATGSVIESSKINYTLPYPGLLPDNPLYFLKAAREKITSFFISDPIKKAEFDLLQADKRIEASRLLLDKDKSKIGLAQSTFSKGENYFESALDRAQDAKSQGVEVSEISQKLINSNQKYHAVLDEMIDGLSVENREKFGNEQKRLVDLEKRAKKLSK